MEDTIYLQKIYIWCPPIELRAWAGDPLPHARRPHLNQGEARDRLGSLRGISHQSATLEANFQRQVHVSKMTSFEESPPRVFR